MLKLFVRVTGQAQTSGKIASLMERMRNLGPAYLRSGVVALTSFQGHIREDGPGWPPQASGPDGEVNQKGSLLYRTGALFRSLQLGGEGNVDEEIIGGIRVGTNLKTPDGQYSIGRLMQEGTGPITPKHAKLLVFEVNGHKVFARATRGIPKRPFVYFDAQTAEKIRGVFATYIMGQPTGGLPPA